MLCRLKKYANQPFCRYFIDKGHSQPYNYITSFALVKNKVLTLKNFITHG